MDFQPFIDRYEKELFDEVIPFWEEHCVDKEFGGILDPINVRH